MAQVLVDISRLPKPARLPLPAPQEARGRDFLCDVARRRRSLSDWVVVHSNQLCYRSERPGDRRGRRLPSSRRWPGRSGTAPQRSERTVVVPLGRRAGNGYARRPGELSIWSSTPMMRWFRGSRRSAWSAAALVMATTAELQMRNRSQRRKSAKPPGDCGCRRRPAAATSTGIVVLTFELRRFATRTRSLANRTRTGSTWSMSYLPALEGIVQSVAAAGDAVRHHGVAARLVASIRRWGSNLASRLRSGQSGSQEPPIFPCVTGQSSY